MRDEDLLDLQDGNISDIEDLQDDGDMEFVLSLFQNCIDEDHENFLSEDFANEEEVTASTSDQSRSITLHQEQSSNVVSDQNLSAR